MGVLGLKKPKLHGTLSFQESGAKIGINRKPLFLKATCQKSLYGAAAETLHLLYHAHSYTGFPWRSP